MRDESISFFQKYLTIWVVLCMLGGIDREIYSYCS